MDKNQDPGFGINIPDSRHCFWFWNLQYLISHFIGRPVCIMMQDFKFFNPFLLSPKNEGSAHIVFRDELLALPKLRSTRLLWQIFYWIKLDQLIEWKGSLPPILPRKFYLYRLQYTYLRIKKDKTFVTSYSVHASIKHPRCHIIWPDGSFKLCLEDSRIKFCYIPTVPFFLIYTLRKRVVSHTCILG